MVSIYDDGGGDDENDKQGILSAVFSFEVEVVHRKNHRKTSKNWEPNGLRIKKVKATCDE